MLRARPQRAVNGARGSYDGEDGRVLRWLLADAHTRSERLLRERPDLAEQLRDDLEAIQQWAGTRDRGERRRLGRYG
jgi:hypothetical protein